MCASDSPPSTVGFPGPTVEEHYCPLVDPLLSSTEKIKQFPIWVSGYYTHTPQTFDAFSESTYDVLPSRADFLKGLSSRRDVQPSPTSTRIAPETLKVISDDEGLVRSHLPIIFADLSIFKEALERALFDDDLAKRTFPNVTVEVVVCSRSTGYCVFAGMEIYKLMLKDREARDGHPAVRKVSLHIWEGMNHAVSCPTSHPVRRYSLVVGTCRFPQEGTGNVCKHCLDGC